MQKIISTSISILSLVLTLSSCSQLETTQPQKKEIINAVFASGHVIAEEEYQVTANTEGYLAKRFVDEGVSVKAGMPLVQLSNDVQAENLSSAEINYQDALRKLNANSPERAQLELQVSQAKAQLALDKKNHERHEKLYAKQAVSQLEYEKTKYQYESALNNVEIKEKALADFILALEVNAKNAKSQLMIQKSTNEDYFLASTIDGVVLKVFKQPGELVRRGEVVALIGGGPKLARLFVAEEDIEAIALGQQVFINLNTQKEINFEGSITKIYPSFDEIEQSFVVEASFKNAPDKIYHNTQLQANILIDQVKDALVIPSDYLSEGDSVYVEGTGRKYVEVGIRNDLWIQVKSGLDETYTLLKPKDL